MMFVLIERKKIELSLYPRKLRLTPLAKLRNKIVFAIKFSQHRHKNFFSQKLFDRTIIKAWKFCLIALVKKYW